MIEYINLNIFEQELRFYLYYSSHQYWLVDNTISWLVVLQKVKHGGVDLIAKFSFCCQGFSIKLAIRVCFLN